MVPAKGEWPITHSADLQAVLASVITLVVYSLLDEAPHDIIFFWKMKAWTDFLQMTGTFLLTILFSIEVGVVASVCFSLLLVIQRSTQPRIKIIGRRPDSDDWVPIDDDDEAREEIPGVVSDRARLLLLTPPACCSHSRAPVLCQHWPAQGASPPP